MAQISAQMDLPIRARNEAEHPPVTKTKGKKKSDSKKVQKEWEAYFGTNNNLFSSWQQLGRDLGFPEEKLTSKTQIRKVS